MTRFAQSRFCRFVSLFLAFVMLHAAPGLRVYEAVAQIRISGAAAGTAGAPVRVQLPIAPAGSGLIAPSAALSAPGLSASPFAASASAPAFAAAPTVAAAAALPAPAAASAALAAPTASVAPAVSRAAAASAPLSAPAPAAAPERSAALATVFAAAGRLVSGLESARVPAAAAPALDAALNRTFDGSRDIKDGVAVAAPGAASIGAEPRLSAASLSRAAAPSAAVEPPSAPQGPAAAPSRSRVAVGLGLAVLGAAAAFFTAPWAVAVAGSLLAGHLAVSALTIKAVWIGLGVMAGFSAFSIQTWKNYPHDIAESAKTAGGTTFRFWGRFGLIFDSVLRGRSTDEAMKAELPANVLRYPLIAWPFVVSGYVLSPVAFLLGAGYQLVGTPVLAAFRGLREVAVGFFPWLARVFRFVSRLVIRSAPFAAGFVVGALRTAGLGGAAGAAMLAGPVIRDAASDYASKTVPGTAARLALVAVGYASALVLGALGFAAAVVSSPLAILFGGLQKAFDWSGVSKPASGFFGRWLNAMEEDKGLNRLVDRRFPAARVETLGTRVVRVANGIVMSLLEAAALPFVSLGAFVRATSAAWKGETVPEQPGEFGDGVLKEISERPVATTPGLILPIALAALGAAGGVYVYAAFGASYLALSGLWALGAYAAAALTGAGLGLAASQPKAFRTTPSDVAAGAADGARLAWGGWSNFGGLLVSATAGIESKTAGTVVGALPGAAAAAGSFVLGGAYEVSAAVTKASWNGFLNAIREFLPFLRRALDWAKRVLRRAVPYAAGFVVGTVAGVFKGAGFGAVSLLRPLGEMFELESNTGADPSEAQMSAGIILALTLVPAALVVGALGLVLGASAGLPFALVSGAAKAGRWANVGPKSESFYKFWEKTALPRVAARVAAVNRGVFSASEAGLPIWRMYVRAANVLLGSVPTAAAMLAAAGEEAHDLGYELTHKALGTEAGAKKDAATPSASAPVASAPSAPAPSAPAARTPVILVALAGVLGLAVGAAAGWLIGVPALAGLAGWKMAAGLTVALGVVPAFGAATGLSLSQASFWKNLIPQARAQASAGAKLTYQYWSSSGEAASAAVLDEPRGPSLLALPYKAAGGLLAAVWGAAGAAFGAAAAFGRSAVDGARQVVEQILPFLKTAFETVMKVLRRIVPFVLGLLAGLVSGVIGSAAFGALLLGRPYFKHVVAAESQWNGALGFVGTAVLKLAALVAGVFFGLAGVVAGTLIAAPYALTGAVALAFRFADIGGPAQKFLDQWTYGALRQEMQRINQLTNRFQFPEGAVTVSAGWIRMANILPATIAAALAATVAGAVSYVRSLRTAYVAARDGKPIPPSNVDGDRQWESTWRSSKKAARSIFGLTLTGAAAGLAGWLLFSWAPLGFAGWLLVAALAGLGATLSLTLAGGIAAIALMYWIGGQLR